MSPRPAKRRRKQSWAKGLQKRLSSTLVGMANRIDFIKLVDTINQSSAGSVWAGKNIQVPIAFPDLDRLKETALELAMNQIQAEGGSPEMASLRDLIEKISCQYDYELHQKAVPAITALMYLLFEQDPDKLPFCSADGRDMAHLDQLKRHQDEGLGVIYLSNHSAHMDEFVLACSLTHAGLKLPLFAAGANMFIIKSLAPLLMLSSYVVQRRGASRHNLAALFNFCRAISETGGQQAIFLEAWHGGARSRDGSLRYPRRLVTLRGALEGDADRVIQPVAISYSAVPEDLSLAGRKSGLCWLNGMGFWNTVWQMIHHPRSFLLHAPRGLYGRAFVSMPRPLLLSELRAAHEKDQGGMAFDEFVALRAIREIARSKKVMASQLAARALTRCQRRKESDLEAACQKELARVREYHQSAFGQDADLEDFVRGNEAPKVLKDGLRTLARRKVVAKISKDPAGLPKVLSRGGLSFYATHGDRRIYSPTADQNIVVAGSGDWGFALTYLIGNRILDEKRYLNASLSLFKPDPEEARELGINRSPEGRFSEFRLPKNAFVTFDATSAFRKASEVILAAPPQELEARLDLVLKNSAQAFKLVVATCGFDQATRRLPCQIAFDLIAKRGRSDVSVYALTGPAGEADLVEGRATYGILAGPQDGRRRLADLFQWPPAKVEMGGDPLGVQAATICARIYAVWIHFLTRSGQVKGAGQVGFFTAQAAAEATKLALALGGSSESFMSGAPAWTATYTAEGLARHSRELGSKLAAAAKKTLSPDLAQKIFAQAQTDCPGGQVLDDLRCAMALAKEHGLDLPILSQAHGALCGG